jgi:hypothetical protein
MKHVLPVIAASLLVLTGCASRINSDVTVFHDQIMPAGETIRVVAADPENNQSLEFKTYANRISDELRKLGYTPVTEADVVADLIAEVDYSVDLGPTEIHTDRSCSYMRYHFGFGRYYNPMFYNPWYSGFYSPMFYDPFFDQPEVYSTTTYNRSLEMNILKADGDNERVFEGRVESNGTEGSLPEVMPYLITAMFSNFPGESGTTKLVTIEKNM